MLYCQKRGVAHEPRPSARKTPSVRHRQRRCPALPPLCSGLRGHGLLHGGSAGGQRRRVRCGSGNGGYCPPVAPRALCRAASLRHRPAGAGHRGEALPPDRRHGPAAGDPPHRYPRRVCPLRLLSGVVCGAVGALLAGLSAGGAPRHDHRAGKRHGRRPGYAGGHHGGRKRSPAGGVP